MLVIVRKEDNCFSKAALMEIWKACNTTKSPASYPSILITGRCSTATSLSEAGYHSSCDITTSTSGSNRMNTSPAHSKNCQLSVFNQVAFSTTETLSAFNGTDGQHKPQIRPFNFSQ